MSVILIKEVFEKVFGDGVADKLDAPQRVPIYKNFNKKSGTMEVDELLRIFSDKKGIEFQTTMDKLTAWFMSN